jgi:hypothetical protein
MFKLKILLFFIVFNSFALPPNYENFYAKDKQNILWNNMVHSRWRQYPAWQGGGFCHLISSLPGLAQTFSMQTDEFPEKRIKVIHTHGVVAKINLVITGESQYTGLFKSGAIGFVRLSLAANPDDNNFIPGMALKFLIDKSYSLNILAMHNLEGQGVNHNWFAHDFSNIIPEPQSIALKTIGWFFSLVRDPPNELSLNHLANIESNGASVSNPKAPYKIIFEPAKEVKDLIEEDSKNDFRDNLNQIKKGAIIYDIYLQEDVKHPIVKVGYIQLMSNFLASEYGDYRLFFQHHY